MNSLSRVVEDIDFVLEASSDDDVRALYDRAARRYDHFREPWLRFAGADAEQAMIDDLTEVVRPEMTVLDAGCGSGALARRITEIQVRAEITLLDLSPEMLRMVGDLPRRRIVGSVLDLPFAAERFDVLDEGRDQEGQEAGHLKERDDVGSTELRRRPSPAQP